MNDLGIFENYANRYSRSFLIYSINRLDLNHIIKSFYIARPRNRIVNKISNEHLTWYASLLSEDIYHIRKFENIKKIFKNSEEITTVGSRNILDLLVISSNVLLLTFTAGYRSLRLFKVQGGYLRDIDSIHASNNFAIIYTEDNKYYVILNNRRYSITPNGFLEEKIDCSFPDLCYRLKLPKIFKLEDLLIVVSRNNIGDSGTFIFSKGKYKYFSSLYVCDVK